jgi:hypothetical protein
MPLTNLEREVLTDSVLKIQSIQASLDQIDDAKILDAEEIHGCLKTADNSFRAALRADSRPKKQPKR